MLFSIHCAVCEDYSCYVSCTFFNTFPVLMNFLLFALQSFFRDATLMDKLINKQEALITKEVAVSFHLIFLLCLYGDRMTILLVLTYFWWPLMRLQALLLMCLFNDARFLTVVSCSLLQSLWKRLCVTSALFRPQCPPTMKKFLKLLPLVATWPIVACSPSRSLWPSAIS